MDSTVTVPGVDFDLTPPSVTAPRSKTVVVPRGVKRGRVPYVVTARDEVDGAVPVTCKPKSRSWFPLGRTRVRCTSLDKSGNLGSAGFVVTVKTRAS